jgi:hypothetical protein
MKNKHSRPCEIFVVLSPDLNDKNVVFILSFFLPLSLSLFVLKLQDIFNETQFD